MAHENRYVQVPGLRWFTNPDSDTNSDSNSDADSDTDADSNTDANSNTDSNADADSGTGCPKQSQRDNSVGDANQSVVD